jgi:D-alanine-D-alanine ligase
MDFAFQSDPRAAVPAERESSRYGRVALLVDQIAERAAGADELAPAQSTARIMSALETLGYEPVEVALHPDRVDDWLRRVLDGEFDLAFNLCETIGGRAAGEHLTAAAVELLEIPMTGASSATLLLCLNKSRCSAILRAAGFRVPEWRSIDEDDPLPRDWNRFPAIIKPAAEDASNGIHSRSVVHTTEQLLEVAYYVQEHWGRVLIQEFIEGREINLAIVGNHLLPPAEIDFSTLPEGFPAIVSFAAKWHAESPEFGGTVPICPAPFAAAQVEQLQRIAARAWRLMDGYGYARVDVRLTDDGTPYVIDINPNPDLSIDAGLARQARVAGWSYEELVGRIIDEALDPGAGGSAHSDWTFVQPAAEPAEVL